jgi:hypothetical protein
LLLPHRFLTAADGGKAGGDPHAPSVKMPDELAQQLKEYRERMMEYR